MWRAVAGDPYPMEESPDEISMFTQFAERGLSLPASDFFKGLLGYYGIKYLNLNPKGGPYDRRAIHSKGNKHVKGFSSVRSNWRRVPIFVECRQLEEVLPLRISKLVRFIFQHFFS
jgi:hypothetical protein